MKQKVVPFFLVVTILAGSLASCFLFDTYHTPEKPSNVYYNATEKKLYWTDNSDNEDYFRIWSVKCVIEFICFFNCPPCENKEMHISWVEANVTQWDDWYQSHWDLGV